MGDPYFHHHLNALGPQDGGRRNDLVDLGSPFHSDASANVLFGARGAGRGHRKNIPMLGEGRCVRRTRGAPSMTALIAFAFVAAGIAAYAASSAEWRGPAMAGGPGAHHPLQDADFPVGTVFLVAPR